MKIVFLDAATLGDTSLEPIRRLGNLITYPTSTPQEALERVKDADIIITNKVKITASLLDAATRLRLICEAATGVNNIDLEAAASRNIPVKNVAAYSTDSVAQLCFTQLLNLVSMPEKYDTFIKSGEYSRSGLFTDMRFSWHELAGKQMGIIGMGSIGQKVAAIAQAFGMKVCYYSTTGIAHCKTYPCLDLKTLLLTSDVVSIHSPLNAITANLITAKELSMMKPTALLLNMARGGIVNEQDLAEAISSGQISGAAVDVFSTEPLPLNHPYMHTLHPERLLLTPHVAWASTEARERLIAAIAANISETDI